MQRPPTRSFKNPQKNFGQKKSPVSSAFGTGSGGQLIRNGQLSHAAPCAVNSSNSSNMGNPESKQPPAPPAVEGKKSKRNQGQVKDKDDNDIREVDISSEFHRLSIKSAIPSSKKTRANDAIKIDFSPEDVLYYGWFFDEVVSGSISLVALRYYRECLENVVNFKRFIQRLCDKNNIKDPMDYYVHPRKKPGKPDLFHITSKFIGRENDPKYTKKIMKYLEKPAEIQMVGLFFTEKCFGIRVKLSDEQNEIFDERKSDRFGQLSNPPINSKQKQNHQENTSRKGSSQSNSNDLENEIPVDDDKISKPSTSAEKQKQGKKKQEVFYEGLKLIPQEHKKSSAITRSLELDFHFQPTLSRAHITIGVSKGVRPVETGNDLLDILDLETRGSVFRQDFQLPDNNGILRQFYKDAEAFVLYPSHILSGAATFNAFI